MAVCLDSVCPLIKNILLVACSCAVEGGGGGCMANPTRPPRCVVPFYIQFTNYELTD